MIPYDIVIFGGSGDLSMRKLMPALYFIYRQGKFPESSRILALSRSNIEQADFRTLVLKNLQKYLGTEYSEQDARAFTGLVNYMALDIADDGAWSELVSYLAPMARRKIIYYMAVMPTLFGPVCRQLSRTNLNPDNSCLVVEKPLGEDEETAEAVNKILSASFKEGQIYRIDHYLGKEAIQNLLSFRFETGAVEPLWNRDHIDNIQITVAETIGVEGRSEFLDRAGILRDMIQNHLMQILCFLAMDKPKSLTADDIRDQKLRVVRKLRSVTREVIGDHVVRAQYGAGKKSGQPVPSYAQENKDNDTAGTGETFIALKLYVDNDRWRDVPFYLRTGKRLSGRFARIVVQLKSDERPRRIILNIQPEMTIYFDQAKIGPKDVASDHRRVPDAYEKLLGDVMTGNQSYFVRHDEIVASWRWIDGIRAAWAETGLEMLTYPAGSMGPKASDDLLAISGHEWYEDK